MRNVSYLGLCWATTLGMVAVALGQQPQPRGTWKNAPESAPQQINTTGLPVEGALQPAQPGAPLEARQLRNGPAIQLDQQRPMPSPEAPQDRSLITGTYQPGQPAMNGGQRRGELGVWMTESGGPGVQIQRVTRGSAAEQAGLHEGDIILQVNGRGAVSPIGAAQLIRQIAIGQTGTLNVWRDGNEQQIQITMQPAREIVRDMANDATRQVGFAEADTSANGDLASRTTRLEQQISSLTQELAAMRQELTQLRTTSPVQTTGFNSEPNQGSSPYAAPQQKDPQPITTPAAPTDQVSPPPGFGSEEKSASVPTEADKPVTPPAAAPAATPPAAPAPAAEKSAATDPFGSDSPAPKTEEKPKTDEKPKAGEKPKAEKDAKDAGDDLFK